MTGIAIMHEDTLAQWLVTIGKNTKNTYKLNLCFWPLNWCLVTMANIYSRMQRGGLAWVYSKLGFNLGLSISLVAQTQFKVVWV